MDELQSSLLGQDLRGYGCGRGRIGARGHGRERQAGELVECYKCQKIGRHQNECPNRESKNANFAKFDDTEEMLHMAQKR